MNSPFQRAIWTLALIDSRFSTADSSCSHKANHLRRFSRKLHAKQRGEKRKEMRNQNGEDKARDVDELVLSGRKYSETSFSSCLQENKSIMSRHTKDRFWSAMKNLNDYARFHALICIYLATLMNEEGRRERISKLIILRFFPIKWFCCYQRKFVPRETLKLLVLILFLNYYSNCRLFTRQCCVGYANAWRKT